MPPVVPGPKPLTEEEVEQRADRTLTRLPSRSSGPRWTPWEDLLWRAFEVRGRACPRCGERMELYRVVLGYAAVLVFRRLGPAARGPPAAAAS